MMMRNFRNFSLKEFIKSDTASQKGIDNTPDFEAVGHLCELTDTILQPLRDAWGKPLIVSSGYRCAALNKAVGGSGTSAHLTGYAADIQVGSKDDLSTFIAFAQQWLRQNGIPFDQSIKETSSKAEWWHIGLYGPKGEQRGQFMKIDKR